MLLKDVVHPDLLAIEIETGHVRKQVHPGLPLAILNYTEKCVFAKAWDPVTLACRGLIYNTDTQAVVARPFEKFFNYGEYPEGTLNLNSRVEVTDKLDGSLGILYWDGTDWAIATRGSFTSEQAVHATRVYRERYEGTWVPVEGFTYLFEIVYPGNRIVCDYGTEDDLYLLGCVDNFDGSTHGPSWTWDWRGPRTEVMEYRSLSEALAAEPRPGAEGLVVRFKQSDVRVKIKQDDYVELHRLVTGMNARVVWERLGAGETLSSLCEGLPEEFWPWVKHVGIELLQKQSAIVTEASARHYRIIDGMPDGWTRKDYALIAKDSAYRPFLFMLLDDRDIGPAVWKTLKPSGERALVARGEDAA